ncbi:DsbC/DsbD-like thiol-disulfide interchange protein [Pseudochelatococcus lubricantis]|uniref:DsbC/DsbD-like thiol-disulfide interchange protein n=1 Tax=Pseudochelatococcus lubricantis TaxID=1538102 RepID=A0ABX0UYH7_9HYPH|nr:protein-disulfide reductase DsbD domain-containing protein [Pseudochelatococcus lubricantis]NIJ57329.1 DsbC/DsbD-like thiol-disulfide interchange protein [Pseudochelatococcus lubricantis]
MIALLMTALPYARRRIRPGRAALLAALVCCLAGTGNAHAAPSAKPFSPSGKEPPAHARLLDAGRDEATGQYRAVVEIVLAPGYKTYWREPGDSGVPTTFDWEGSRNVAAAQAFFPAPTRFFDGIGYAVGYLETVRFPVLVDPAATGPAALQLELSFGVCREICIPEQASLRLDLSGVPAVAGLWEEAHARVPVSTPAGQTAADLVVRGVRLDASSLTVEVAGAVTDVFAEAPAPWRFGQPARKEGADGAVFVLPVEKADGSAVTVPLTLTVTGERAAIEVPVAAGVAGR